MKKLSVLILSIIYGMALAQNANTKVYFPQKFFDKNVTENALAFGKSTIRGTAFVNTGDWARPNKQYAKNKTVVMLFPVTDYFAEWYELKKANKGSIVAMLPEAFAYRLETETDEYGNFEFPKMKPGKYYLESTVDYVGTGIGQERIGTVVSSWYGQVYGVTPVYENYYYNYDAQQKVNKIVEITQDGQLIEVKLKPKTFENFSTGSPTSSKCYQLRNKQYGTCKEFFENGKIQIIADWDNHLLDGNYVEYNIQGIKIAEGKHKKGFKTGVWKYYDDKQGFLYTEQTHKFKDNISKLDGEVKFFFPSGKIKTIDLYINGVLEGESKQYFENGKIDNIVFFRNGVLDGKATFYDENGNLLSEVMYKNGKESK